MLNKLLIHCPKVKRETALIKKKARLLDMYTEEREECRALQPLKRNHSFWSYLRLKK